MFKKFKYLEEGDYFRFQDENEVRVVSGIIGIIYYCPVVQPIKGPSNFQLKGPDSYKASDKEVYHLTFENQFSYSNKQGDFFNVRIPNPDDLRDFFLQINNNQGIKYIDNSEFDFSGTDEFIVENSERNREIGILLTKSKRQII